MKDGYAMNFLIKNGYAMAANQTNLKNFEKQRQTEKLEESLLIKDMESLKQKIEKETLKFQVKTGEQEKMFGTISAKQIKEELSKLGYNIDKTKIKIDHPIMSLGMHTVQIELHKEVLATIKIHVQGK